MINTIRQGTRLVEDENGTYTEYICSNVADTANLPTGINSDSLDRPRPGSLAVVITTGDVYMLSPEREWISITGDDKYD